MVQASEGRHFGCSLGLDSDAGRMESTGILEVGGGRKDQAG